MMDQINEKLIQMPMLENSSFNHWCDVSIDVLKSLKSTKFVKPSINCETTELPDAARDDIAKVLIDWDDVSFDGSVSSLFGKLRELIGQFAEKGLVLPCYVINAKVRKLLPPEYDKCRRILLEYNGGRDKSEYMADKQFEAEIMKFEHELKSMNVLNSVDLASDSQKKLNIFRGKCNFCGIPGHLARDCKKRRKLLKDKTKSIGDCQSQPVQSEEKTPVVNTAVINSLSSPGQVDGGDVNVNVIGGDHFGKAVSESFDEANENIKIGMKLHLDIGCFTIPSIRGHRYFLLAVDHRSRYLMLGFMRNRSDTLNIFKRIVNQIKLNTGTDVNCVCSNFVPEFCSDAFQQYLTSHGIVHQRMTFEKPRLYGSCENVMRTLLEHSKSILLSTDLPCTLWDESINYSVFVFNRSKNSNDEIPYEIFFGKEVDVSNFQVFGSRGEKMDKESGELDPKTSLVRMVGYQGQSVYRVYCPAKHRVELASFVNFDEKHFCNVNNVPVQSNVVKSGGQPDFYGLSDYGSKDDVAVTSGPDRPVMTENQIYQWTGERVVPSYPVNVASFDTNLLKSFCADVFLNGDINEEVHIQQSPGFDDGTDRVCLLLKGLYDSPRYRAEEVSDEIGDRLRNLLASGVNPYINSPPNIGYSYRQVVGALLNLSSETRSDAVYTVSVLSRFTSCTTVDDFTVKGLMRYLNGTNVLCIVFGGRMSDIAVHLDADIADDKKNGRTTTRHVIFCAGPVVWSSNLQKCITDNAAEADFIIVTVCSKDIHFIVNFLDEIDIDHDMPVLNCKFGHLCFVKI